MVRSFGLLLIAGVAIAFALALPRASRLCASVRGGRSAQPASGGWSPASWRPRRQLARTAGPARPDRTRPPERFLASAIAHPARVLGIGLALAVIGWGVGHPDRDRLRRPRAGAAEHRGGPRTRTSCRRRPASPASSTSASKPPTSTDPATIEWMADFKRRVLRANGFGGENPSCLEADICPGPALSDFLTRGGGPLTRAGIEATLAALSPYALRQVAPLDPRPGSSANTALLSFGIRAQSLADQQALIDRVRAEIGEPGAGRPAAGVEVELAGLPVIAAEAGLRPLRQPLLADPGRSARGRAGPARCLPLAAPRPGAAGADRARDRLGLAGALAHRDPAQPDVGRARGADDRDRHRVRGDPRRPLPRGAGRRRRGGGGAAPRLRPHRRRRARLRRDRDRRLRGPDRQRHPDAAGLRHRHRRSTSPSPCSG